MKHKKFNQVEGFTLVELLVVVAIIAILSVIGLTIFTSAQSNARDARRKADIDAIANAIEVSRTPGKVYYTAGPTGNQFSGGVIPSDSTRPYCISQGTTSTPPIDATGTWTTCPSGWSTPQTATWGTSVMTFKVCASLESGSVYCKPSSQ